MIADVLYLTIPVSDQDEALAFYTDVLGFEKRDDEEIDEDRWLTVALPGVEFPQFALSAEKHPADVVHVVGTDDCRGTYETLRERGVTFHGEPTEQPWGVEVVFEDPDGNRFDLIEPSPMDEITVSERRNEEIARRYVEDVWSAGDVDVMDDLLTEQQVYHDPTFSGEEPLSEFKAFIQGYRAAFPDLRYELEGLIAENDTVAFWGRVQGTHEGAFQGIDPTGNLIDIMGIGVVRIEEGKIAERWANFDTFGLLKQLGVDPLTEEHSHDESW